MENIKEKKEKRICKYGIQRESCRECLFEVLCNLEYQNLIHNRNKDE